MSWSQYASRRVTSHISQHQEVESRGDSDRRARRLTCYLHLHGVIWTWVFGIYVWAQLTGTPCTCFVSTIRASKGHRKYAILEKAISRPNRSRLGRNNHQGIEKSLQAIAKRTPLPMHVAPYLVRAEHHSYFLPLRRFISPLPLPTGRLSIEYPP